MSTYKYPHPNGTTYDIGTIGIESFKPTGFYDFFRNAFSYLGMIKDIIIPTYGLWAGPGYGGGERPLSNKDIKWAIKEESA